MKRAVVTIAVILFVATANTYELATARHYTVAVLFGALVPVIAVADYWFHRNDPANNQDRMLMSLMIAFLGYGVLLASL